MAPHLLQELQHRTEPTAIILVEPEFFQVVDKKNPYMRSAIDQDLAQQEWRDLLGIYKQLEEEGVISEVSIIKGVKGAEDMVFCANQSLPWIDSKGNKQVVLSNMKYASRQKEVAYFEEFYSAKNYVVKRVDDTLFLEGMGDCIFHPYRSLLWMGHGYRTSINVQPMLEQTLEMPVIPLKLISEYFYHLDTCFLPLSEQKVMLCPEAFDEASMKRIQQVFNEVIEVDRGEAMTTFCLNTHCIYNKEVAVAIVPAGDHSVKRELGQRGVSYHGSGYFRIHQIRRECVLHEDDVFWLGSEYGSKIGRYPV